MFFVYINYSTSFNKYYIGHSDDPSRRLLEHNDPKYNKYTSKYRPWELKAAIAIGEIRGEAMKVESYLKDLKSRKIIEQIINRQSDQEYINYLIKKALGG